MCKTENRYNLAYWRRVLHNSNLTSKARTAVQCIMKMLHQVGTEINQLDDILFGILVTEAWIGCTAK